VNKLLLFLNLVAITALLFSYASPLVSPNVTWFFSIFGLFFPIIVLINLLFIAFWLWKKPKKAWFGILALLLGFMPLNRMFQFNLGSEKTKSSIKVMTYNLRGRLLLHSNTNKGKEARAKVIDSFFKELNDVDVFCFQEQSISATKFFKKTLSDYEVVNMNGKPIYIYSKHPVVNKGIVQFPSKYHNATYADLAINEKDTIRIYNVHLSSNRVSTKAEEIIAEHDLSEPETWSDIKYIFSKYALHSRKRVKQSTQLITHMEKSPYPVTICGDFNDVPQSYVYGMFNSILKDSFKEAGFGLGSSYRMLLPFLRIDYVFAEQNLKVLDHEIIDCNFSDHYPVSSVISFAN